MMKYSEYFRSIIVFMSTTKFQIDFSVTISFEGHISAYTTKSTPVFSRRRARSFSYVTNGFLVVVS